MINERLLDLEAFQIPMRIVSGEAKQSSDMYESQQLPPAFTRKRSDFSVSIPYGKLIASDPYVQMQPCIDALGGVSKQFESLQRDYVFLGDHGLIADVLTAVPTMYSLLRQALQPLNTAFGQRKVLQLEALQSDEDTVLRIIVKLPSATIRPTELMRSFKREWWLKNCAATEAALVFDYETSDEF